MSTATQNPRFDGITALLLLILLMLCLFGCVTQKKCNDKFPPSVEYHREHTTEIIKKDSLLPGSTVYVTIPGKDSTVIINRWYTVKDTNGIAELRYRLNNKGQIEAECEAKQRLVETIRKTMSDYASLQEKTIVREKYVPVWVWLCFGVLGSIIIGLMFRKFFGRIMP